MKKLIAFFMTCILMVFVSYPFRDVNDFAYAMLILSVIFGVASYMSIIVGLLLDEK